MGTKLTLKLDAETIKKAKKYARQKQTSLSTIVEVYLKNLTASKKEKYITDEIKGCLSNDDEMDDETLKKGYYEHQLTKYSKRS